MTDETRQSATQSVSHVERHPGPFIGPDVDLARACAVVTIADYGNDTPEEHQRIMAGGIWNDHIAVQTALTAIHSIRKADGRAELRQLISDLSSDLTDEGANYSTEGLHEMRRRVANALGKAECPDWLHEYLDAEVIQFPKQLTTSHRPEGK